MIVKLTIGNLEFNNNEMNEDWDGLVMEFKIHLLNYFNNMDATLKMVLAHHLDIMVCDILSFNIKSIDYVEEDQ